MTRSLDHGASSPNLPFWPSLLFAGNVCRSSHTQCTYTRNSAARTFPFFMGGRPLNRPHQSAQGSMAARVWAIRLSTPAPSHEELPASSSDHLHHRIQFRDSSWYSRSLQWLLSLGAKSRIAVKVGRCVNMGRRAVLRRQRDSSAEYNSGAIPAAQIVLRIGLPIELVGFFCGAPGPLRNLPRVEPQTTLSICFLKLARAGRFAIECTAAPGSYFEQTGEHGISGPGPVAMSIALDPSIVTQSPKTM